MYQYFYHRLNAYPNVAQKGFIDFTIIKCKYNNFVVLGNTLCDDLSVKKNDKIISNNYYLTQNKNHEESSLTLTSNALNNIKLLHNGIMLPKIGFIKLQDLIFISNKAKIHKVYISEKSNKYFITIVFKFKIS